MGHVDNYKLDIKALDPKKHTSTYDKLEESDRHVIYLDFSDTPEKIKGKYVDVYESINSKILYTANLDEISDLRTTYLGNKNMTRSQR